MNLHGSHVRHPTVPLVILTALLVASLVVPAAAPAQGSCRVPCSPTVSLMSGGLRTHLLRGPVVRNAATGAAHRVPGTSDFEAVVAVAARPGDRGAYTHELDLKRVANAHLFAWAPPETYLHRVAVYLRLDHVATGLPRAGDEVPEGRSFVTAARPTSLVIGLTLLVTPPP